MGQLSLSPALKLPNKEDRWRYCCHLEGEVPIELQLASARSAAQEAAQMQAMHSRSTSPWAGRGDFQQWPGPPGAVRSWPAIPPKDPRSGKSDKAEDQHFPEVVRASGHRRHRAEPSGRTLQGTDAGAPAAPLQSAAAAADAAADQEEEEARVRRAAAVAALVVAEAPGERQAPGEQQSPVILDGRVGAKAR
mmetsp:Transcript_112550/g.251245  ORF Transcript_112550/g.251245 Transcript_112550/m.251245 type:complete len:192 (+) Transcript_112550:101-676(+)